MGKRITGNDIAELISRVETLVVHHGARWTVMKMIIYHGNTQNWQRTVIKMKWNRHAIHVIKGASIHPGLNEIVSVVNENAYLLGEAVKKIDDLSSELEELKGKLNNEH